MLIRYTQWKEQKFERVITLHGLLRHILKLSLVLYHDF